MAVADVGAGTGLSTRLIADGSDRGERSTRSTSRGLPEAHRDREHEPGQGQVETVLGSRTRRTCAELVELPFSETPITTWSSRTRRCSLQRALPRAGGDWSWFGLQTGVRASRAPSSGAHPGRQGRLPSRDRGLPGSADRRRVEARAQGELLPQLPQERGGGGDRRGPKAPRANVLKEEEEADPLGKAQVWQPPQGHSAEPGPPGCPRSRAGDGHLVVITAMVGGAC